MVKTNTGEHGTTALDLNQKKVRIWMQVAVSLIVLVAAIIALDSPNAIIPRVLDESTKRLATGWIGAVIGYWLS